MINYYFPKARIFFGLDNQGLIPKRVRGVFWGWNNFGQAIAMPIFSCYG